MKNIAVLLTCHNRKDKTIECLRLLYSCILPDDFNLKVFLVDDGSIDGTGEAISSLFPDVNVMTGNGDLYWNRGMHMAWVEAKKYDDFDFFLWLNDDTFLYQRAILTLFKVYNIAKSADTIVCASICSEITKEITYGGFNKKNQRLVVPNGEIQNCDYFNGNCILIPYNVSERVGLLDERFHHSLGDFDYGKRAVKKGVNLVVTSEFIGTCEKHTDFPKWCSPKTTISKRFELLYKSSCDTNPFQYFLFDRTHNGLLIALFHFFTINLRACIPSVYNKRKSV